MKTTKEIEAESFLGNKVEEVIRNLKEGRTLKPRGKSYERICRYVSKFSREG